MADNSLQSSNDMLFSVNLDSYSDADVVAFGTIVHKLGKIKDLVENISQPKGSLARFLTEALNPQLGTSTWWVEPGAECEILKVGGKEWKRGRLQFELTVKFYPDEPDEQELPTINKQEVNQVESTLDDIRRTLNN